MGFEGLTPSPDVAPAAWIAGRLRPFAEGVGSLVPDGYEAYADVAGSADLIGRLLADRRFETVPCRPDDGINANSHMLNP